MKKILPLFSILLCLLLSACSKDDNIIYNDNMSSTNGGNDDLTFFNYGIDTTNLITKFYYDVNKDTIEFTGIKNGHLWFAQYNTKSKQKLNEWNDIKKTDNPLNVNFGYGKYNRFNFNRFYVRYYKMTGTCSIVNILFHNYDSVVSQCIFIVKNISEHRTDLDIHKYYELSNWYGEYTCMRIKADQDVVPSYVIYDVNGDSIFSSKSLGVRNVDQLISASQYIDNSIFDNNAIMLKRYDLLNNSTMWSESIPLGFVVSYNTKVSYTIQKQDSIWTYNYVFLFYDGSEKKYNFSVNINTGTYI